MTEATVKQFSPTFLWKALHKKGKTERLCRRVDQQLTHERQRLIDADTCRTLEDLNQYWEAWLEQGHHPPVHRT